MDARQGWQAIDGLRGSTVDFLRTLAPSEWEVPSLCRGWTVREVAAHLSVATLAPNREVLHDLLRARGSFDAMVRDNAVRRAAARTDEQIVADLASTVGSRRLAPTTFWRDPLLDLVVHTQDMVRPLGRTAQVEVDPSTVLVALAWVWRRRFPFFPARRLAGVRLVATDADWRRGTGPEVRGPVLAMLLLSTGRFAAVADLSGSGLVHLDARRKLRATSTGGA